VRRVPHTAVRKRIAEHMVQSLLHTAPHVTAVFEADLSAVLQDRARQRDEFARRGVSLTLTAYFVQATVAAIRAVPEANSRWTDTALEIYDSIHVGVGTAVAGSGLVAPVLRDAQALDLFATARGLGDLVTRARTGKLVPADVRQPARRSDHYQPAAGGDSRRRQTREARSGGGGGRRGEDCGAATLLRDPHPRSSGDGRRSGQSLHEGPGATA
jgi:hypothetical protein